MEHLSILPYSEAFASGTISATGDVSYALRRGKLTVATATFTWLGDVAKTQAARCCFLCDVPVFQAEGVITRIERDGIVAELIRR